MKLYRRVADIGTIILRKKIHLLAKNAAVLVQLRDRHFRAVQLAVAERRIGTRKRIDKADLDGALAQRFHDRRAESCKETGAGGSSQNGTAGDRTLKAVGL